MRSVTRARYDSSLARRLLMAASRSCAAVSSTGPGTETVRPPSVTARVSSSGGRFGVRRRLWLALLVGVGRLRFVATELRLQVEEVDDLLLVFAHPFSLSVSAAAVFPSSYG